MRTNRIVIAFTIAMACMSFAHAATRERAVAETVLHNSNERLSVGGAHACEVQGDGTVRCWGDNSYGQLGDGTTTRRLTPVTVPGFNGMVAVAAGQAHTCALFANGRVYCWGDNSLGQLGDGTNTPHLSPVAVLTGTDLIVGITAGTYHTCAVTVDGKVGCWGNNASRQLGDGSTLNRSAPIFRTMNGPRLLTVSAGGFHTCALTAFGQVFCWGDNSSGQLGDGTTIERTGVALAGGGTLQTAAAIAAGSFHTCAVLVDGTARCWGENGGGQLGDRSFQNRPSPVAVDGLTNAVAMTGSSYHTCALLSDGGARCWGLNSTGELGDGTNTDRRTPVAVSGLDRVVAIDSGTVSDVTGFSQTCALRADGTTRCWGSNVYGQLGNGSTSDRDTPGAVSGLLGSVTAREIALGANHTCALRADSTVACWGDNGSGQLGDNGASRNAPTRINGLDGVVALAAGTAHTCALLADGTVRCWGAGGSGQLGDGGTSNRSNPVTVSGLTNAVAVAAGSFHTCAALVDGTMRCWGANAKGQIGDGSRTNRSTPTVVSGATLTVGLAAGGEHTCALLSSSIGRCWGAGAGGQTGDGFTFDHLTPMGAAIDNAVGIAAGDLHACVVRADGGASCWGTNVNGQLGSPTMGQPALTPRPVNLSPLTTARIAAGAIHSCSVQADSTARCWGDNSKGQLGNGTTNSTTGPVTVSVSVTRNLINGPPVTIVSPISGVIQVAAGNRHSCALNATGFVRCWGENTLGQLGDASNTDRLRPVTVPSFSLNIDPSVSLVEGMDRQATVTILASCEVGQRLHVDVELVQGDISSRGVGTGECTGALERYPVAVHVQGPDPHLEGPAEVHAEADIRQNGFVDHQEWTRRVTVFGAN